MTNGLLLAGLALMLVGFAFKVAAVPFHMWTPDVYEGAPTPVTGFMAAVAKAGAFAALLRVLFTSLGSISTDWRPIIYGLAVLSLLVGSVVALRQRDVKRMLAYSSINHAGFILLGVESGLQRGVSASLYYLVAYMFMTIGSFAIVTVLGRKGDGDHDLTRYRGLAQRQPLVALSFAVLLLAQAGAPFTTGLWAKLQVVLAAVAARVGAAGRDRHGLGGHRRLLLPPARRAHVRGEGHRGPRAARSADQLSPAPGRPDRMGQPRRRLGHGAPR